MGLLQKIKVKVSKTAKAVGRELKKITEYYTLKQYAKFVGVPLSFIKEMVKKNKLPVETFEGEVVIPRLEGKDSVAKVVRAYEKKVGGKVARLHKSTAEKKVGLSFSSLDSGKTTGGRKRKGGNQFF